MNKKMLRNIIIAAVSLLVIVGVILMVVFIPSCSKAGEDELPTIDYGTDLKLYVDGNGMHCAEVVTNPKGEIENNSYGTLIDYVPADIAKIDMKTPKGNYTFTLETPVSADGKTDATVYTLMGFEDYELQPTNPSLLASSLCKIDFSKVVDLNGEKSSEFGFDNPRATGTAYYTDGTYSKVILGADAAGGETCYVKFGNSNTIYLVNKENIEPMLYDITDLFSVSINSDKTFVADDSFSEITLGGSHLSEDTVIAKNTDEALDCYYVIKSKGGVPVSNITGSRIMGTIKSLNCEDVVCVSPDDKNLQDLGLKEPYATVKTVYTYEEKTYDEAGTQIGSEKKNLNVSLLASKPDENGYVNLMEENGKLVYKILASSVPWVTVTDVELRSEYVFSPAYSALSQVSVKANNKTYNFTMGTEEKNGATVITVSLDGNKIDESQFYTLCQDLALVEIAGQDNTAKTTDDVFTVTYTYSTGRASDTVIFSATGSQKVMAKVNGELVGYVYKDQVDGFIENAQKVASGQEIASVL